MQIQHGLAQGEGEWGYGYLAEILQKHFASVLLTEISISGAEWGKWNQHTSSAVSEVVNPCETRSLMQGSNCESNFGSSQWSSDYCELESTQRCLEVSVQCCQGSLWSGVVHLLAYPSVLIHSVTLDRRGSGSQMHHLFVQMYCEFQLQLIKRLLKSCKDCKIKLGNWSKSVTKTKQWSLYFSYTLAF